MTRVELNQTEVEDIEEAMDAPSHRVQFVPFHKPS